MRVQIFTHVPFEGPGYILKWVRDKGFDVNFTQFFKADVPPSVNDFDFLVIMGGPMGVYDPIPWFEEEERIIREAIDSGKKVLGVCLGAQLIAKALGARVYKNTFKEIGWFDVRLSKVALSSDYFNGLGPVIKPFHWHGDTFDIPGGFTPVGSSEATKNQGFFGKNVLALQFHLEVTAESLKDLIENGKSELIPDKFVMTDGLINKDYIKESNRLLSTILDRFINGRS